MFEVYFGMFLSVVSSIVSIYLLATAYKWKKQSKDNETINIMILTSLLPVMLYIMTCYQWVPRLLNPEFYALMYLINP